MKIDYKLIIILVLIIVSGFFYFKWINASDDELARENKKLMAHIKEIGKQRDSLESVRLGLVKDFEDLNLQIKERDLRIERLKKDLERSNSDLRKAQDSLKAELAKMDIINKEIEKIKQFPPKREGEDLLNSLSKKLKK